MPSTPPTRGPAGRKGAAVLVRSCKRFCPHASTTLYIQTRQTITKLVVQHVFSDAASTAVVEDPRIQYEEDVADHDRVWENMLTTEQPLQRCERDGDVCHLSRRSLAPRRALLQPPVTRTTEPPPPSHIPSLLRLGSFTCRGRYTVVQCGAPQNVWRQVLLGLPVGRFLHELLLPAVPHEAHPRPGNARGCNLWRRSASWRLPSPTNSPLNFHASD